jgi:hypothetical protein
MIIAYAITICNEFKEADRLIRFLKSHIRWNDHIYVLLDKPKVDPPLLDLLYRFSSSGWITLRESAFHGDFSKWKNELIELCNVNSTKPDFIFNIDADELPTEELINILPDLIDGNPEVDADGGYSTKIYRGKTQLYGMFNSTTMTFASTVKTLKEDELILRKYTNQGHYPDDYKMFLHLRENGKALLCPLNTFSTHGETAWLAPLYKTTQDSLVNEWSKHI